MPIFAATKDIRYMKTLQSSIVRAICSIGIGALLIKYPTDAATWIVIVIGSLFLLSGIVSCASYYIARRRATGATVLDSNGRVVSGGAPFFPIVGMGSLLLGVLLVARPQLVMDFMAYVLGFILLLGAINLIANLIQANTLKRLPIAFWICPMIILLVGIIALLRPMWIAGAPLVIIGWCLLLYGITDIINALKINTERKRFEQMMKQASTIDVKDSEEADAEEVE